VSRSETSATTTDSLRPDGRTLGVAAVGGVLAYLVGYALTYAAVGQDVSNSLASRVLEIATGDPGTWQLVGWVFYNAHYVSVEVPGLFGSTAVNLVGETFSSVLFVLPPVVLLVGGAAVAVLGRVERPVAGAVAGLAVTIGYLPLAALGALLVGIDIGDSTAGPTVAAAVLLAGLVYPLVFGAIGGAVGGVVGDRR
jgi:hypothetical protein